MPGQPGKYINWIKLQPGTGDFKFLETVYLKLLLNFTWWVNRKDEQGNNIFEGGFLGMDNIGLFDRNTPLPDGSILEQSDSTSWMCMYSLNMMRIALELASYKSGLPGYGNQVFRTFSLYSPRHVCGWRRRHRSLGR